MSVRERESLIARIRQVRRARASTEDRARERASDTSPSRVDDLEARVAHLEQLLQGLQDSVHRESSRQEKLIADLQAQVDPAAMGAALDKDARDRRL